MRNLKQITAFVFGKASYHIEGKNGERIVLTVDYQNNDFAIEANQTQRDQEFELEVKTIAADLLKRKHGVNFANQ